MSEPFRIIVARSLFASAIALTAGGLYLNLSAGNPIKYAIEGMWNALFYHPFVAFLAIVIYCLLRRRVGYECRCRRCRSPLAELSSPRCPSCGEAI